VVPVGAPLARIVTGEPVVGESDGVEAEREERPTERPTGDGRGKVAPARPEPAGEAGAPEERVHGRIYSPIVQRLASEHGVDLAAVQGTGRGGRVRKQDVLALIAAAPGAEPLSRMRRAIAEHMTRSLRTAAHCTTIVEADFSAVEEARARLGCSPLPFVARAAIDALGEHPALNATLEGEMLTRHRDVNLGIAVSLGERGLIVPVIPRAQELSVEGLAARVRALAERARAGELTPDEVRGGSFTITNPGGHGSIASTPIINQPQVAILDLEAVVRRVVVVTDTHGREALAIRPMAFLCLSWDHRALDGALAAQFLATLRGRVEGS